MQVLKDLPRSQYPCPPPTPPPAQANKVLVGAMSKVGELGRDEETSNKGWECQPPHRGLAVSEGSAGKSPHYTHSWLRPSFGLWDPGPTSRQQVRRETPGQECGGLTNPTAWRGEQAWLAL